jgi:hypothetical protein
VRRRRLFGIGNMLYMYASKYYPRIYHHCVGGAVICMAHFVVGKMAFRTDTSSLYGKSAGQKAGVP